MDHKGWIRLGDGQRREPLTLADTLAAALPAGGLVLGASTHAAAARPVMERAFKAYGLPEVIRSDNGSPFASASVTGLTALSVWWIKLGVRPERITPGRPQENGRLERFHLTLLEAMRPPAANRAAQARRLEAFRRDYNHERPHQALKQVPPADFYTPSPRPMPKRPDEPDYTGGMITRKRSLQRRDQVRRRPGPHLPPPSPARPSPSRRWSVAGVSGSALSPSASSITEAKNCYPSIRAELLPINPLDTLKAG